MTVLLTQNGVPMQKIGHLTQTQMAAIGERTRGPLTQICEDGPDYFENWSPDSATMPVCMQPFACTLATIAGAYTAFGSHLEYNNIMLRGDDVGYNDTSLRASAHLHSDYGSAGIKDFIENDKLTLRTICVSSMPTDFIDITGSKKGLGLLDDYREVKTRILDGYPEPEERYQPALKAALGIVERSFKVGDIVLFDHMTPHQPILSTEPHWRFIQLGYQAVTLPPRWRARVAAGDQPGLHL